MVFGACRAQGFVFRSCFWGGAEFWLVALHWHLVKFSVSFQPLYLVAQVSPNDVSFGRLKVPQLYNHNIVFPYPNLFFQLARNSYLSFNAVLA
jgi:hypothetical protein